jgi:hypothetical protein
MNISYHDFIQIFSSIQSYISMRIDNTKENDNEYFTLTICSSIWKKTNIIFARDQMIS